MSSLTIVGNTVVSRVSSKTGEEEEVESEAGKEFVTAIFVQEEDPIS